MITFRDGIGLFPSPNLIRNQRFPIDLCDCSEENVAWLQETGRRYLIGTPESELKKWSGAIAEARGWRTVRDGVEAKLCPEG